MLKKCLKYDLRANYKKWLVLSLIALSFSVIGSLFLGIGFTAREEAVVLETICFIIFVLSIIVVVFYPIAVLTITSERCYKSFFTDEGYLTFTLPVSRRTHLNSKIISTEIFGAATTLVILVSVAIMIAIESLFDGGTLVEVIKLSFSDFLSSFDLDGGFHSVMIVISALLLLPLISIFCNLLIHFCIIFGSVVAKRHKIDLIVITINVSCIVIAGLIYLYIAPVVAMGCAWMDAVGLSVSQESLAVFLWLLLLTAAAILVIACALLYRYCLTSLERRLNLA